MAQYILKDALVAEIERLIERANAERVLHPKTILAAKNYLLIEDYNKLLSFLDILEVKDVDLDKEIDNFFGMYRKNGITFSVEDNQECLDWKVDCNPDFEKAFAKHFFELGLKAIQKGENYDTRR